ncbi:MAG: DNA repair protein RadA [Myxococcota bacterium]
MAKAKTVYVCQQCGSVRSRWMGRCTDCGEWNTFVEERADSSEVSPAAPASTRNRPVRLGDVCAEDARRLPSGVAEFDRAVGGGLVVGGVVLLGGEPGIGKSTLTMQVLSGLAAQGRSVLYVTGEESASQVAMRAARIGGEGAQEIAILATTQLEDVETSWSEHRPEVVVIDSVQTLRSHDLSSTAGSVAQVREVAARLTERAKVDSISMVLIGHVTKEGSLAGPKVLEHLVDTVLSFEGDRTHAFRMVRAVKNRFGPAHETGVFEMLSEGLRDVPDPSAMLLSERPVDASGSVVVPTTEGSRCFLVEVQALVAPSRLGASRRVASGLDASRMAILLAVIERKAEIQVLDQDVFASLTGGIRLGERGLDLGLAIAVVSSFRDRALPPNWAVFGEVGLAGEVRAVAHPERRIAETAKLGFSNVILPKATAERLGGAPPGLRLHPVAGLSEAFETAFHS